MFFVSCKGADGGIAPSAQQGTPSPSPSPSPGGNSPPTIGAISTLTIYEARPVSVSFTIGDADGALTCTATNLSATSSNALLLPVSNIIFGGTYPNCTANLALAAGQSGASNVSISVTDGVASASQIFTVNGNKINSVSLTPVTPIVPKNSNFSFKLTATYSDASTKNITSTSTWGTSNGAISSFPSPGVFNNTYAGVATASATVTATYGSFSANTLAKINPGTVTSLIVDPSSALMNIGGTLNLKCYGLTSDGGTIDLTQSCSWSSANATIVTVDNNLDKGQATAVNLGSATNVTANYAAFNSDGAVTVDVTAPSQSDNGLGLTANYYTGLNFNTLVNTRMDSQINFNWATNNNPAGNATIWSARWTGFVKPPTSGLYTFYTQSDDGVRLWVNGVQLVNNWTDHATTQNSGTINLVAGTKYAVTLEYYQNGGFQVMQLSWSGPSVGMQAIPQNNLYP